MSRKIVNETQSLQDELSLIREELSTFRIEISHVRRRINALAIMGKDKYVSDLLGDSKYQDARRLERHGFKVYSQHDEDGIIQEIFDRIGIKNRVFVEFGVANGLENNTLKLLLQGWQGLWIEGSAKAVAAIDTKFYDVVEAGRLQIRCAMVDRENINTVIGAAVNGEIDLLSIDIDGNDIYVLEEIKVVTPRVIVIEYNGKFPPSISVAQRYNPAHQWRGTDYVGSSLAAITKVAARKGYSLVGCGIVGVNAFFVRNDLVGDKFQPPFTAENHYQPARYFLSQLFHSGHTPDWGEYIEV
jgi:hypothetical protein